MRILYLGTPDIAVPPLEALVAAGYEIVAVVTQPDQPARRSTTRVPSPVRQAAERLGLPVQTPQTLKDPQAVAALEATRPELAVVAAYGEILRQNVLAIPRLGFLNIHPSLLPRHRGPAPVVGAILAGDDETGVTIMQLDRGMDSGPLLAQQRQPLAPDARAGALTEALFSVGAKLLVDVIPAYAAGELQLQPQDHSQATITKLIRKDDGQIDWALPALQIERMTRAYDPWPGATTSWRGQPLKILAAEPLELAATGQLPGTILPGSELLVATGAGALRLVQVQAAGRRPVQGQEFRRNMQAQPGDRLG